MSADKNTSDDNDDTGHESDESQKKKESSNAIKFEDFYIHIPLCIIHNRPSISYCSLTSDIHDDCQQVICFNCLEERQTICSTSPILMKYRDLVCGSCFYRNC